MLVRRGIPLRAPIARAPTFLLKSTKLNNRSVLAVELYIIIVDALAISALILGALSGLPQFETPHI